MMRDGDVDVTVVLLGIEQRLNARLDALDGRLEAMEARLDALEARGEVDDWVNDVRNAQMDALDGRLEAMVGATGPAAGEVAEVAGALPLPPAAQSGLQVAATLTRNLVQATSARVDLDLGDEDMENLQTAHTLLTPPECALPRMCQAYLLVREVRRRVATFAPSQPSQPSQPSPEGEESEVVKATKAILRMIREFVVLHICCVHGSQDALIFESALRACFENDQIVQEVWSQLGLSRGAIRRLGHVNNPLSAFKAQVQKSKIWGSTLSDADVQALFELYGIAALDSNVGRPQRPQRPLALGRRPLAQGPATIGNGGATAADLSATTSHWSWGVHSDHWHWAGDHWHC